MIRLFTFLPLTLLLLISYCSKQTTEALEKTETVEEKVPEPKPQKEEPGCATWNNKSNQEEIMTNHVLYRDQVKLLKAEQRKGASADSTKIERLINEAFPIWQKAFKAAPAADGKRAYHFEDGITFFEYYYQKEGDGISPDSALQSIMSLYDGRMLCYGEEGYIFGRKAFDYFYKYPGKASDEEMWSLFKKSLDTDGKKANYFILNPMTALLTNGVIEEKISVEDGREYQQKIKEALEYGLANCKGDGECAPWKIIEEYVPARLEQLEGIQGFYDCAYFKEKYFPEFEAAPSDCDAITRVLSRLNYGGCNQEDAEFQRVLTAYNSNCRQASSPTVTCRSLISEGKFSDAIDCYKEKAEATTDNEKKAQYLLVIAKIYYGELKRFSLSRKFALEAASVKPGWGNPYILIGKLYASSGPLCGPGRGWDSQIVTWPAIDMWYKAKKIDPSVSSEANKLIGRYTQYMPSMEDIFQRGLKVGSSFKVPCWIQENTTIRPAK